MNLSTYQLFRMSRRRRNSDSEITSLSEDTVLRTRYRSRDENLRKLPTVHLCLYSNYLIET